MKARRVCAECGKTEGRWRMFKIWKGTSHDADLCSFECSGAYYGAQRRARVEASDVGRSSSFPPDFVDLASERLDVQGYRPACKNSPPSDLAFLMSTPMPDREEP